MRQALMNLDGVLEAVVSYDEKRADVRYRGDLVEPSAMVQAIHDAGFKATIIEAE